MANRDRISELYDGSFGTDPVRRRARSRLHWMCQQAAGKTVLDVGCSQGIASVLLAREGKTVVGVDREGEAIRYALDRLRQEEPSVQARLTFQHTELIDYSGGPFDTVLLGEVLEHQVDPAAMLSIAMRLLKPKGRLVLTTPYGYFPHEDHKEPLYLETLLPVVAAEIEISELRLVDAYVALAGKRRRNANDAAGIDWRRALELAERRLRAREAELEDRKQRQRGSRPAAVASVPAPERPAAADRRSATEPSATGGDTAARPPVPLPKPTAAAPESSARAATPPRGSAMAANGVAPRSAPSRRALQDAARVIGELRERLAATRERAEAAEAALDAAHGRQRRLEERLAAATEAWEAELDRRASAEAALRLRTGAGAPDLLAATADPTEHR